MVLSNSKRKPIERSRRTTQERLDRELNFSNPGVRTAVPSPISDQEGRSMRPRIRLGAITPPQTPTRRVLTQGTRSAVNSPRNTPRASPIQTNMAPRSTGGKKKATKTSQKNTQPTGSVASRNTEPNGSNSTHCQHFENGQNSISTFRNTQEAAQMNPHSNPELQRQLRDNPHLLFSDVQVNLGPRIEIDQDQGMPMDNSVRQMGRYGRNFENNREPEFIEPPINAIDPPGTSRARPISPEIQIVTPNRFTENPPNRNQLTPVDQNPDIGFFSPNAMEMSSMDPNVTGIHNFIPENAFGAMIRGENDQNPPLSRRHRSISPIHSRHNSQASSVRSRTAAPNTERNEVNNLKRSRNAIKRYIAKQIEQFEKMPNLYQWVDHIAEDASDLRDVLETNIKHLVTQDEKILSLLSGTAYEEEYLNTQNYMMTVKAVIRQIRTSLKMFHKTENTNGSNARFQSQQAQGYPMRPANMPGIPQNSPLSDGITNTTTANARQWGNQVTFNNDSIQFQGSQSQQMNPQQPQIATNSSNSAQNSQGPQFPNPNAVTFVPTQPIPDLTVTVNQTQQPSSSHQNTSNSFSFDNHSTREPYIHTPLKDRVNIPKIDLPTFDGKIEEWESFSDHFYMSVHNDPRIDVMTKMNILKSSLKGSAERLAKGYRMTAANYPLLLQSLHKRYKDDRRAIRLIYDKILDISPAKSEGFSETRRIEENFNEQYAALEKYPNAMLLDTMLFHTFYRKVHSTVRIDYDREFPDKKIESTTLQEFREFVDNYCRAREGNNDIYQSETSKNNSGRKHNSGGNKFNAHVCQSLNDLYDDSASSPEPECEQEEDEYVYANAYQEKHCHYCDEKGHCIWACEKFNALDNNGARQEAAMSTGVCFNCLRTGHGCRQCTSKFNCTTCNGRHHSLLHNPSKHPKDKGSTVNHSNTKKPSGFHKNHRTDHNHRQNNQNNNQHKQNICGAISSHCQDACDSGGSYHCQHDNSGVPTRHCHDSSASGAPENCWNTSNSGSQSHCQENAPNSSHSHCQASSNSTTGRHCQGNNATGSQHSTAEFRPVGAPRDLRGRQNHDRRNQ